MTEFTIHTIESAPQDSKEMLEKSLKSNGMIANLHATMAEAPNVLAAYLELSQLFQNSSFNAEEITVVWQTINVEHKCHYCVPAHTAIAHRMKVDPILTEALRNKEAMPTTKLQTLHDTTLAMVRQRGELTTEQVEAFLAAGYSKQQLLEIILGVSHKVISNYVNHIAKTPVDAPFTKFAWNQ